ncbi:MAG: hypothetical protein ABIC19_04680, partial [Patescibacteria group bacterium]
MQAQAATWYVRPSTDEYGAEDGTSYAAAFDGVSDITWAAIDPGDTLYICGTHSGALFQVRASGSQAGGYFTIRGDYEGDPGVITSSPNSGLLVRDQDYVKVMNITSHSNTSNGIQIDTTNGDHNVSNFI